ncbi:uncharacterized protein LOC122057353 isoform X2 [Macadamia integrifolia]|uniref:uncharacterized protein LOC122057353 isoform X2 n=1 Tax=Macadamia integrifolia TaxID=60698 RepID=UPI001C52C567|nr:uncharacterized protein LOC122057353 isoform X2 [Macadamia integrifolia]
MNQLEWTMSSLPEDIALKIASLLQVSDLCSLGSCSRFWREFCASDSIWIFLFRERWPSMVFSTAPVLNFNDRSSAGAGEQFSSTKGWRAFYINRHIEMANRDAIIAKFVKQCSPSESLEADYVVEALWNCQISERQVCVRWWKLGRWIHGFRLRDESHTRMISLGDLAMAKEGEVFGVLHRGAIHEVLRVQISVPAHTHTRWTF